MNVLLYFGTPYHTLFCLASYSSKFHAGICSCAFCFKIEFSVIFCAFFFFLSNMKQRRKYLVCCNISRICSALHSKCRSVTCGIKKNNLQSNLQNTEYSLYIVFLPSSHVYMTQNVSSVHKSILCSMPLNNSDQKFWKRKYSPERCGCFKFNPPIPTQSFSFQMKN